MYGKSRHTLPLVVLGLAVGGASALVATLIDWLPPAASREAGRVDDLIWFTVWASIAIFTIVVTFLLYSVWKFRAAPGDESDGPPIHGNTKLEILWTAVPAALLVITAVYSAIVLSRNEALAAGRATIDVTGEQFAWSFTYPEGFTTGDLRVPLDRQVQLRLHAKDVIHDVFVPAFRIKGDAVPGIVNDRVRWTPNRLGTYPLICAELCGLGHNVMRSRVIVMPAKDYDAWVQTSAAAVKKP